MRDGGSGSTGEGTFDALLRAREAIHADPRVIKAGFAPAGVFVPYVGSRLPAEGGI